MSGIGEHSVRRTNMTRIQTASTYLSVFFFTLSWVGANLVADEPQAPAQFIAFKHNNVERKYLLHVPQNLPDNAPLVFLLHGYRADARDYTELGMNHLADANGFAVCYPQGADDLEGIPHWNARLKISKTDDIGFLSALASHLQAQHSLTWENRDSIRPVPILQVSSLHDEVIPYDGSMAKDGGWGGAPNQDLIMEFWRKLNKTKTEEVIKLSSKTTGHHYKAGVNGNEVWHYKIREFGHSIPGEREMEISVAELIWKFFSKF